MYDGNHVGTIVMNVLWGSFNLVILGVATSVAWESRQRRQTVRLPMTIPANVELASGAIVPGVTADVSSGGVMVRMEREFTADLGDAIKLTLPVLDGNATLPATIVGISGNILRAQFDPLTLQEEEALTMVLYSRADTWLGWGETREADRPLTSLARIFKLAFHGLERSLRSWTGPTESPAKGKLATSIVPLLLLTVLLSAGILSAQVPREGNSTPASSVPEAPATFDHVFTLADLGVPNTIVLHGVDAFDTVHFSLPQNQVVKTATMRLRYHFSPGLIPSLSHLKVGLNGTLFATLPVTMEPAPIAQPAPGQTTIGAPPTENSALLEATLTLPAEMLAPNNELTFEFVGHYTVKCEDPSHSTLWSHVDNTSTIELAGSLVTLHDDLKLLPAPFYDSMVDLRPVVPIVFLTQPSPQALQAAGIVASWFGILADSRPVRFPVSVGAIPPGNAVVIGESSATLPASLQMNTASGPTIAMRANPSDPYSKVTRPHRWLRGRRADRSHGAHPPARPAGRGHRSRAFDQDARTPSARRRTALAQHRKGHQHRRHRTAPQLRDGRHRSHRLLHAPSARSLLRRTAKPRLSSGLPLQRHSYLQRQHPAGLSERLLCQFDALAAHRQGLGRP